MVKPQFILAFDPSLDGFGYAVIDVRYKNPRLAEKGMVSGRNTTWGDAPHSVKLALIASKVKELRAKYQPLYNTYFSEMGFTMGGQNKSNHGVFKARGAMEVELVGMEHVEIAVSTVKKAATGNGRAEKTEVQEHVARIFGIPNEWSNDNESDAVAVGYTGYINFFTKEQF
jgi:Holliday junction resolvasome RuvABC endonuclease subunit